MFRVLRSVFHTTLYLQAVSVNLFKQAVFLACLIYSQFGLVNRSIIRNENLSPLLVYPERIKGWTGGGRGEVGEGVCMSN